EHPGLVATLSIVSGLARATHITLSTGDSEFRLPNVEEEVRSRGSRAYLAATGRSRMGTAISEPQLAWRNDLMGEGDGGWVIGLMRGAWRLGLYEILPRVQAPTLVLAAADSVVQSIDATREWQQLIPDSELQVLPGDSPHLAAERPDDCAARVLDFI